MQSSISYTAVGHIVGTYHPSSSDLTHGILTTTDNLEFPALAKSHALKKIAKEVESNEPAILQTWRVYPRTLPVLQFALMRMVQHPIEATEINQFKIVGEVIQIANQSTIVRVYRTLPDLNSPLPTPSFTLKLSGIINTARLGEIWMISATRSEKQLNIVNATLIALSRTQGLSPESKIITANQPTSSKSRFFRVQVQGQTFVGKHSVQLKAGVLRIDNQPIIETEIAVVSGPIQSVDADRITPAHNELILQSQ